MPALALQRLQFELGAEGLALGAGRGASGWASAPSTLLRQSSQTPIAWSNGSVSGLLQVRHFTSVDSLTAGAASSVAGAGCFARHSAAERS